MLSRSGKVLGTSTDVIVADLRPPRAAGETYTTRVEFPIRAEVTIASDDEPLSVTRDVAIVPNHVWIARGTPVQVMSVSESSARIMKRFAPAGSRTTPASFTGDVRCDELALSSTEQESRSRSDEKGFTTSGLLELFAAPGAKRAAVVQDSTFTIVEKRGTWTRVKGRQPFMFDGWMKGAMAPASGVLIERAETVPANIALTRELEFRLGPTTEYPVEGQIAAGAELLVGRSDGDVTMVQVAGLVAPYAHARVLFVSRNELRGAWRPLTASST